MRREKLKILKLLEFTWWLAGWFAPHEEDDDFRATGILLPIGYAHHQPANHPVITDCFGTLAGVRLPDRITFSLLVERVGPRQFLRQP